MRADFISGVKSRAATDQPIFLLMSRAFNVKMEGMGICGSGGEFW